MAFGRCAPHTLTTFAPLWVFTVALLCACPNDDPLILEEPSPIGSSDEASDAVDSEVTKGKAELDLDAYDPDTDDAEFPHVSRPRLERFLACEKKVRQLVLQGDGEALEAYLDTDHGRRMSAFHESPDMDEATKRLLGDPLEERKEDRKLAQRAVRQADAEKERRLQDLVRSCGFEDMEQWEIFGARVQQLRRWRMTEMVYRETLHAQRQMRRNLEKAVAQGQMTKAQRDAQLSFVPNIPSPNPPDLEPPVTRRELEVIRSFEMKKLVPGFGR